MLRPPSTLSGSPRPCSVAGELAAELRAAGHPYKWIGEQIGVTAQAVEGFIKYQQGQQQRRDPGDTAS